ncbi:class I SAM-dependent methyltransferase [Paenibacillus sinopodophylli]|uniref:class I SAM-dependent methyltransferase n=1 Tax=Paenibacillus sinopodophylli TaxID=1837342 RepID=UPI003CCC5763
MFLRKFIQNPKQIGSIIPSSRFLARKMIQAVSWREVHAIAELGSGTGAITRFIQPQIDNASKVFLFELDDIMRRNLKESYPQFICHSNACNMNSIMNQHGIDQLDCIISGLPFFTFENEVRETLLHQITNALKPGGYLVAFQYSLQMKKHLLDHFVIEKIDLVPFNIPPAFVYVCRKRDDGEMDNRRSRSIV